MLRIVNLLINKVAVKTFPQALRMIKIVIGFSLLLIGLMLIVLPGPATIVIPIALAILASEFIWARRLRDGSLKNLILLSNI